MNKKPQKSRFLITLVTNSVFVFILALIIWKSDLFNSNKEVSHHNNTADSILIIKDDSVAIAEKTPDDSLRGSLEVIDEIYHPFTNDVRGSEGELVEHSYYRLSYNEDKEQADWVAYHITPEMLVGDAKRKNNFKSDPKVGTESAHKNDYKGTKYDKGHLMPAATCKFDQLAMNESFYMSNMSPQYYSFNRGIWKKTEELVRDWVVEFGHLYVISGPASYIADSVIGENRVAVPSKYYKVVLYKNGNDAHTAAFLINNEKSAYTPYKYLVPVDSVEKVTGLDFFWELPDSIEVNTEKYVSNIFQPQDVE